MDDTAGSRTPTAAALATLRKAERLEIESGSLDSNSLAFARSSTARATTLSSTWSSPAISLTDRFPSSRLHTFVTD
jgi:hypothetical protein